MGMTIRMKMVELTRPPTVHRASADQICRLPSVGMRSKGRMPNTVVHVVMKIGRTLSRVP
jgi:hypothetical protein